MYFKTKNTTKLQIVFLMKMKNHKNILLHEIKYTFIKKKKKKKKKRKTI